MKIVQFSHNYLTGLLSKKSKFDGRLLVIAALLGYFGIILLFGLFTDYARFWNKLGVPAMHPPFADLRNVTSGFECTRLGYDVLLENPCDPLARPVIYPRVWMTIAPLGIDQNHTIALGIVLVLLLYISVFSLSGKLNYYEGLFYSLILCSPSCMLLVERGNVDIIIFLLLSLSWVMLCKSNRLIGRYLAYSLVFFAAVLKLFPIFGLTVLLKEKKKTFVVSAILFTTPFLIYCLSHSEELREISKIVPDTNSVSYGYRVIFYQVKGWLSDPYLLVGSKAILSAVIKVIFFMASFLIGCKLVFNAIQEFKIWKSGTFQAGSITRSDEELSFHIDSFRLGCSLYIGTFMLGSVFDYKLIFLLFTIPQILDWIKKKGTLSLPSSFALLGITATLYLSASSKFSLDEVINWFLLGYFVWSFLFCLPRWFKSLVHNISF